jgi:hypothetical protein
MGVSEAEVTGTRQRARKDHGERGRVVRFPNEKLAVNTLGVHLHSLDGQMGHRLQVLMKWSAARFGERQSALIEGELASVERASPPAQAVR